MDEECALEKVSFERLNYFYGQVLGLHDFRDEQAYVQEKLRLHNRCLHGWGVVCGLDVRAEPGPVDECVKLPPGERVALRKQIAELRKQSETLTAAAKTVQGRAAEELGRAASALSSQADDLERVVAAESSGSDAPGKRVTLHVGCGLALDPRGHEIVVGDGLRVDLWTALSAHDRRVVEAGGAHSLWVSICYAETPTRPVRPIAVDRCATPDTGFARVRESACIRVSLTEPASDLRCDPCCQPSHVECVLLARIDGYSLDAGVPSAAHVHDGVRRMLSLHDPATITAISWAHGAEYGFDDFQKLLGHTDGSARTSYGPGLALHFSRAVRVSTLAAPGVLDVTRIGGGGIPAGGIQWIPFALDDPGTELASRVAFRQATDERWSPGDRLQVTLRCDFVLDRCCLPVDGNHVGGRVPLLADGIPPTPSEAEKKRTAHVECARSPRRPGAWRSGNGTPGGTFESWFYVGSGRAPVAGR